MSASFHLDIWCPLLLGRPVHYSPNVEPDDLGGTAHMLSFSQRDLFEQVYSWSPDEDVWGGIADEARRSELRELFLSTFDAQKPPHERQLTNLKLVLDQLDQLISDGDSPWVPSQQTISRDDTIALSFSPVLALKRQLAWLLETFADVPSLCVTVR